MVRPLNLEELDGLIMSFPFRFIKDANRLLAIGEIFLEIKLFMINFTDRILEATTKLGNMEDVMNVWKVGWKLQLIGEIPSLSYYCERSNIARSKFALDSKMLHSSKRRDTEVDFVTDLKVNLLVMLIIITLLPGLSSFKVRMNDLNLFLSIINHIRTKERPLSGFRPI